MKIFLAGNIALGPPKEYVEYKSLYVLQTFYDLKKQPDLVCEQIVTSPDMFFLDSGAFTFMNSGVKVDWEKYLNDYACFINRHNVKYFFEIDLDTIIGVKETQKMTKRLESLTGKQCIPVFHRCRGMEAYKKMCQQYDYVAIGASGITEECRWVRNDLVLKKMVSIAHEYGCKIHGLGYTRLSNINDTKIPFDSVDSSSCLSGGRFATVYKFTGNRLISKSIKGKSAGYKKLNDHNIKEWIKMQYYKDGRTYEL